MTFALASLVMQRFGTILAACINTRQFSAGKPFLRWRFYRTQPPLQQLGSLELGRLKSDEAERWVTQGLACPDLSLEDEELLQATACDLLVPASSSLHSLMLSSNLVAASRRWRFLIVPFVYTNLHFS